MPHLWVLKRLHASLPRQLSELVPTYLEAVPTDPFTGQPLKLAIKKDQWIIYSVGPDRVDDGGVGLHDRKGDVTFTLKLLPTPPTTLP